MSGTTQLVVFRLDGRRYALPLEIVERVVRAVEVTPLPGSPPLVLGVVNVHGRVLPVLDVRRRFGLPGREIHPGDCFVLARTARRPVVLAVDESDGVLVRRRDEVVESSGILPGLEHFPGVVRLSDGLALIHDLDRFLSLSEELTLDTALGQISDT